MPDLRELQDRDPRAYRNRTATLWLVLVVLLVAGGGVTAYKLLYQPAGQAPDFTLTSTGYENGTMGEPVTFNLSDHRGQVVVLDFMGVTCSSCRILTDQVLEPLHGRFGDRSDFVILSIDVWAGQLGETKEELIRLQKEEGVPWRHALDTDDVLRKYSVGALPRLTVVDPQGQIVYDAVGIPDKAKPIAAIEAAFVGESDTVSTVQVGLLGLAFVAGLASFFSPCSVGLLPAYLGFLINQDGAGTTPRTRVRRTVFGGLATGAGIVTAYGVFALLFWGFSDQLRPYIPVLSPTVAVLLILLGALMLVGFDWAWLSKRVGMGRVDGRRGFYLFGIGYGLAAFGCTGPVFLPILFGAFTDGALTGFAVFAIYAVTLTSFVLFAAYLVATGQETRLRGLLSHTKAIARVSAVLLIGAGAYILWFDYQAFVA